MNYKSELIKSVVGKSAQEQIDYLIQFNVFKECFEYNQCSIHHNLDLLNHILKAFNEGVRLQLPEEALVALLFHDVGKPEVEVLKEDGSKSFHRHALKSTKLFMEWYVDYDYLIGGLSYKTIVFYINYHEINDVSEKTWRRYIREHDAAEILTLLDIRRCDLYAQNEALLLPKLSTLLDNIAKVHKILRNESASPSDIKVNQF